MQLRLLPFAASAVAGRGFVAGRPVTERRTHLCFSADNSSPSPEKEGQPGRAEEALRRLAELDAQLEGLKEIKMRPPPPPPPLGNHFLFRPRSPRAKLPLRFPMCPCTLVLPNPKSSDSRSIFINPGQ
jgi:hypothetical protein